MAGRLGSIVGYEGRTIGPNIYCIKFDGDAEASRVKLKQEGCCSAPSTQTWAVQRNKKEEMGLAEEGVPPGRA